MLAAIALLTSTIASAQQEHSYAGFLSTDTSVRWALEADKVVALVPRTLPGSLNRFYRAALASGKLQAYSLPGPDFKVAATTPGAALPGSIDKGRAYKELPQELRRQLDTTRAFGAFCDSCARGTDIELFALRQLVYLKNGRFYVDNILVAPIDSERDTAGNLAWTRRFATSFYKGGTPPHANPKDRVYLGTSTINYNLELKGPRTDGSDRVLTPQEPNPIYPLLQEALRGRIRLRNEWDESPQKPFLNPRRFFEHFGSTDTVAVMDVNDPSRVVQYVATQSSLDPAELAVYGIEQSFYFDKKLQVLFSEVHKVTVKKLVYNDSGTVRGRRALASVAYKPAPLTARQRVEAAPAKK
ncbi:MAG: hypothetical protein EOO11_01165 [Chitinophagaceae bacterium]|nr:MAG: hypothetical protein EOO11_01165 [Chitinophagaceae bacterium]